MLSKLKGREGGSQTCHKKKLKFRILGGIEVHVIQAETEGGSQTFHKKT